MTDTTTSKSSTGGSFAEVDIGQLVSDSFSDVPSSDDSGSSSNWMHKIDVSNFKQLAANRITDPNGCDGEIRTVSSTSDDMVAGFFCGFVANIILRGRVTGSREAGMENFLMCW